MERFDGKTVIVTGATSGIGKATAIMFAENGAEVVVAGRNETRGNEVVNAIKEKGGNAVFVKTDVSNEEDIIKLIDCTKESFGKIDIVVNSAGTNFSKPLADLTTKEWDDTLNTNLRSIFHTSKYAMPELLKVKGNIVNIASIGGIIPMDMFYAYCTSKAGVIMLTQELARSYAEAGVRVNAICPGVTDTPILGTAPQEIIDLMVQGIPMKRMAQPEEIANAILWIASDEAKFVTGQSLSIDGGQTLVQ